MPFRVRHYYAEHFASAELYGLVRWSDVAGAIRAVYLDPRWVPGGRVLWDATGVTALDIPPASLPEVAPVFAEVARAREGGATAFLLGPGSEDEVWILFPRLGPPSTRRIKVLHKRERALAFLGLGAMPQGGVVVAESPPSTPLPG